MLRLCLHKTLKRVEIWPIQTCQVTTCQVTTWQVCIGQISLFKMTVQALTQEEQLATKQWIWNQIGQLFHIILNTKLQ